MPADLDYVRSYVAGLDGVETTTTWGHEAWTVDGKKFAWHRPFSKADIARYGAEPIPSGELVAVVAVDIEDRDAIVAEGKPGFFVIQHLQAHPIYLVQLEVVSRKDLKSALDEAWQVKSKPLTLDN